MNVHPRTTTEQPLNWEQRFSIKLAKRPWIVPVIFVALAAVVTIPLFAVGFPKGGDAVKHYRWSTEFEKALGDGAFYPRWFPEANHGSGSPLPIFYPPVPFYAAAAFNLIAGNMLTAISLSCWLALAISGMSMYGFSRLTLSRPISMIAGALYMLIPYHLLDLYLGSAISEFWSFAWVPLILGSIYRVSARESWLAVGSLALSYALLLQTHVPSAFLMSLCLPIFAFSLTRDARRLLRVAAGLALGAGISAIFILPVLFERKYIRIDRVLFRREYRDYFLFERLGGALKTIFSPSNFADYSVQAELAGVAVLALAIVAGLILVRTRRTGEQVRVWRATAILTALALFMTSRLSAPLYRMVSGLAFLLFPFRWLLVASAGVSLLSAAALSIVVRDGQRRTIKTVALAVIAGFALTVSSLAIARMPLKSRTLERRLSRREAPEYHPVFWDGKQHDDLDQSSVVVDSGEAAVLAIDDRGIRQSYSVVAQSESLLRFRPLYFPGWVARANGRPIETRPSKQGNLEITIEPGEHQLTLSFEDTWPRATGKVISAVGVLGLFILPVVDRRRRRVRS